MQHTLFGYLLGLQETLMSLPKRLTHNHQSSWFGTGSLSWFVIVIVIILFFFFALGIVIVMSLLALCFGRNILSAASVDGRGKGGLLLGFRFCSSLFNPVANP